MTTRRKYSKEFKLDAISLVAEQGYTCAEAARSLDINANLLSRWIREASENMDDKKTYEGRLGYNNPRLV